jgi:hypothetical protein
MLHPATFLGRGRLRSGPRGYQAFTRAQSTRQATYDAIHTWTINKDSLVASSVEVREIEESVGATPACIAVTDMKPGEVCATCSRYSYQPRREGYMRHIYFSVNEPFRSCANRGAGASALRSRPPIFSEILTPMRLADRCLRR